MGRTGGAPRSGPIAPHAERIAVWAAFLSVPAACGLILLGRPLLQLVYQRGAFDAAATAAVYAALAFYALGLVGHICLEVAARVYFAQQDTITPLIVAASMGLLHVLLAITLMGPLGHGGLALANSLAVTAEVLVLLFILRRRWGGIGARMIMKALARHRGQPDHVRCGCAHCGVEPRPNCIR
ncbi:MAG: lipid II flippase MurJ [Caldilineaceae bacterium]